jgi:hypothetical protein
VTGWNSRHRKKERKKERKRERIITKSGNKMSFIYTGGKT